MVYTIIKHETSAVVKDRLALRNVYCIAGKFGGELNLAVWWSHFTTAKLKSAKFSSASPMKSHGCTSKDFKFTPPALEH